MSSDSIKNSNENFLKNCLTLEESLNLAKRETQKDKFLVISRLISDLFEYRDKESYIGISNALISFLSLSNKKHTKTNYINTKKLSFDELDPEFKKIMMDEFDEAIKDLINKKSKQ